jgi:hypothetical protein
VTVDNTVQGKTITTTTTYTGAAVYESKITSPADPNDYPDMLQYIGHVEGRIRFQFLQGLPNNLQKAESVSAGSVPNTYGTTPLYYDISSITCIHHILP